MGKGNSRASKKRAAKKAKAAIKSGNAVIDPSSSVVADVVSTNNSKGGQKVRMLPRGCSQLNVYILTSTILN